MTEIQRQLFALRDQAYKDFHKKLIPTDRFKSYHRCADAGFAQHGKAVCRTAGDAGIFARAAAYLL